MSSYEGLTQLNDHHRPYNFNALHRRSDSVESHGSISSLSSNHSSVGGGRNGVGPPSSGPSSEMSRYRRVDPPRTLNTSGCSPMTRNAFHGNARLSQPQMALLHSTSVMETPNRQQALNRSRSGSCPMVWVPNGSMREHPVDASKPLHPQSNQWVYSPFAYSPRQPDRPLCGQVTGSVQYVGSQHDDCRALGGARMPQGFLAPGQRSGSAVYDGFEPRERYPSAQSLTDYAVQSPGSGVPVSIRRPRLSTHGTGRTADRCPSETDLAQSPSVVASSLQRSLSTMSVNATPNSNFTSKLNCSLSRSYTSKLNDFAQKSDEGGRLWRDSKSGKRNVVLPHEKVDEGGRLRKDLKNGKQNAVSPHSPYEMGLCFNVPQTGHVRRQREAIEKEVPIPAVKQELPMQLSKNVSSIGNNRGQFKHRSFENLSPATKKYSVGNAFAFGESKQENHWNPRIDSRRNAKMKAWTPDEDRPNSRASLHAPCEVKCKGNPNAMTAGDVSRNDFMRGYEKRGSLELTLTPSDSKRANRLLVDSPGSGRTANEMPTNFSTRGNQVCAPTNHDMHGKQVNSSTNHDMHGKQVNSSTNHGMHSKQVNASSTNHSTRGNQVNAPTNHGMHGKQVSASTNHGTRENNQKHPTNFLQSMENKSNGPAASFEGRPTSFFRPLSAKESTRRDDSPGSSPFASRLRNFSRNSLSGSQDTSGSLSSSRGLFAKAISDMEQNSGNQDASSPSSSVQSPSTFVSEVFVSIVKPRPSSGLPRERMVGLQPSSTESSHCASSPIYDNLLMSPSPIEPSPSRSSLPLAGAGSEGTSGERSPWSAGTASAAAARRHSNPTEKMTETSPGVRAHVASQKEHLKVLLTAMKDLHIYRDRLRSGVGQMEADAQRKKQAVADDHCPTTYELERLYEANRRLKVDVQQLSHEIDRFRSRPMMR